MVPETNHNMSEYQSATLARDPSEKSSENKATQEIVPRTALPRPNYVPPLNFSLVEDGIYRSGFPMPISYPFLAQLKLKTIIYLGDLGDEKKKKSDKKVKEDKGDKDSKVKKDKLSSSEILENYKAWIDTTDITFHHLVMHSSQEPFTSNTQEDAQKSLTEALQIILNRENFPILIHSNKGKHRIGVLVGLMRKILQGWCISGIFEEYEKFAMGKSEYDLEFIELWQPELFYEESKLPGFVRI